MAPVVEVAVAESNATDPKFASGSAWQANWLMHSDGASTIHSAELTSMLGAEQRLAEGPVPRQVLEHEGRPDGRRR